MPPRAPPSRTLTPTKYRQNFQFDEGKYAVQTRTTPNRRNAGGKSKTPLMVSPSMNRIPSGSSIYSNGLAGGSRGGYISVESFAAPLSSRSNSKKNHPNAAKYPSIYPRYTSNTPNCAKHSQSGTNSVSMSTPGFRWNSVTPFAPPNSSRFDFTPMSKKQTMFPTPATSPETETRWNSHGVDNSALQNEIRWLTPTIARPKNKNGGEANATPLPTHPNLSLLTNRQEGPSVRIEYVQPLSKVGRLLTPSKLRETPMTARSDAFMYPFVWLSATATPVEMQIDTEQIDKMLNEDIDKDSWDSLSVLSTTTEEEEDDEKKDENEEIDSETMPPQERNGIEEEEEEENGKHLPLLWLKKSPSLSQLPNFIDEKEVVESSNLIKILEQAKESMKKVDVEFVQTMMTVESKLIDRFLLQFVLQKSIKSSSSSSSSPKLAKFHRSFSFSLENLPVVGKTFLS